MASYSTYLYNKALGFVPSTTGSQTSENGPSFEAKAAPNKQIVRFSKFTTISMSCLYNLLPADFKQVLSEQDNFDEIQ